MANDFSSWFTTLQGRSHRRSELLALDLARTWAGCTFGIPLVPTWGTITSAPPWASHTAHRNTIMYRGLCDRQATRAAKEMRNMAGRSIWEQLTGQEPV